MTQPSIDPNELDERSNAAVATGALAACLKLAQARTPALTSINLVGPTQLDVHFEFLYSDYRVTVERVREGR